MHDILVYRWGLLGDVLCITSLIPGIQARFPEANIDLCSHPGYSGLVTHDPRIRKVFEEEHPEVRWYDMVFCPDHSKRWNMPIAKQQCHMVGLPFNPPQYFPTQSELDSAAEVDIAICATARDPRRMSGVLPIAAKQLSRDYNVMQVDNGDNIGINQPKTSLRAAAAHIAKAKLAITIDTSLMHVAVALGVPTIIIFGPLTGKRNQYTGSAQCLTMPSEGEVICLARQLLSQ